MPVISIVHYYLCPPHCIQNMNEAEIQCGKSHNSASVRLDTHRTSTCTAPGNPGLDTARGSGQQHFNSKAEGNGLRSKQ